MTLKHVRKVRAHVHNALIPHHGNGFKPLVFTAGGIATVVLGLLFIQAAYFFHTNIVFKQTDFLASVLPGVLATLTNQDRAKNGIGELVNDPVLARAAQMKAEDMAAKGYFSHVDPEGRAPWYWLERVGYQYGYAGENLAVKFTDSEDVQEAWMNSPTHRANIVKSQYTRIGIGVAPGMYKGEQTTFVVQFFATPAAQASVPVSAPVPAPAATLAVATPAEEPVVATPAAEEEEPVASQVLGAETASTASQGPVASVGTGVSQAQSFFAQVAASPTYTLTYVLAALAGVFLILLVVSIVVHVRVQYLEVIGGGLLILLVIVSLLVFNATHDSTVEVPAEGSAIETI